MECPSCKGSVLKPIMLADNLPERSCPDCSGVLIDLLPYRVWRENWSGPGEHTEAPVAVEDSASAVLCPQCSSMMLKSRASNEQPNKIDVCTRCDTAWLDNGEWELLGALSLQDQLAAIFTDPWQRRLRD